MKAYQDKDTLKRLYMVERKTTIEIGMLFGVDNSTIFLWLKRHNIPIHYGNPNILQLRDKDFIFNEYVAKRKSLPQIAKELQCSDDAVRNQMIRFGIGRRTFSEALKGTKKPEYMREIFRERARKMFKREKHPNWKGGVTSKHHSFRTSSEYLIWRQAIWKRDEYGCAICNSWKRPNAHHIYPLWHNWDKRLDLNNGITLCKKCHENIKGKELEYAWLFTTLVEKKRVNSGKPKGNPEPSVLPKGERTKVQRLSEDNTLSLITDKNARPESLRDEIVQNG